MASSSSSASPTTADRLLEAHVAHVVRRLTAGEATEAALAEDLDQLLETAGTLTLRQLVEPAAVVEVVGRVLATVPPSDRARAVALGGAAALVEHPVEPFALQDVLDRDNVEALVRYAQARVDRLEPALDRLTRSPELTRLAGGFVGRIVGDVLAANRAVAEKIPGLGSLVSFGAKAGGRVVGAADKQLDALLGDTAGKGAAIAVRRLNKVLLDTLRDPAVVAAVLEVWDLYADQPLPPLSEVTTVEDVTELAGILHDIAAAGAPTQPVLDVVAVLVTAFLDDHGDVPVADLLDDLGLTRDELVVHALTLGPPALAAAHEAGVLEPVVRHQLAPFYASDEVAAILG